MAQPAPSVMGPGVFLVAYRKSERSPGRYIEAALGRAGLEVRHVEEIDWDAVDQSTRGVVVVESPLPAMPVRGQNPGIPVVFWVHHGEHHIDANTRLQRHYGAHAVVLAHSWHLAHRFTGLVDRLPFAVAPELFPKVFRPHPERRWDVGFVGSISEGDSRYSQREDVIEHLRHELGDHKVAHRHGITPEEMAELYRDSRVVVDDGAGRHLPITMRVFEATGAGALLFTNPGPGLSQLMEPKRDYLTLDTAIQRIVDPLRHGTTEMVARSGHRHAWESHTYDRRVAELVTIVDRVAEVKVPPPDPVPASPGLARLVERFPDAQRVLDLGGIVADRLAGREVWDYHLAEDRAEPGTYHIAAIAGGQPHERARAIAAARIAVVTPSEEADAMEGEVHEIHGTVRRHDFPEGTAFTYGSAGYRVSPDPGPG